MLQPGFGAGKEFQWSALLTGRAGCWSCGHGFHECSWGSSGGGWVSSGFGVQVTVTALALLCQGRAFTRVLCTPSCDLVPALLPCQALGPQVRCLAGAVLPTRSGTCRACQGHQARLLGFVPWGRGGCAGTASLVRRGHSLTWLDSVLLGLCACPASPERGEESAERAPQHHHPQAGL